MAKAVLKTENDNNNKAKFIEWRWYLLIAGLSMVFASVIIFADGGSITSTARG
jgi:hypothetical protein